MSTKTIIPAKIIYTRFKGAFSFFYQYSVLKGDKPYNCWTDRMQKYNDGDIGDKDLCSILKDSGLEWNSVLFALKEGQSACELPLCSELANSFVGDVNNE